MISVYAWGAQSSIHSEPDECVRMPVDHKGVVSRNCALLPMVRHELRLAMLKSPTAAACLTGGPGGLPLQA